MLTIIFNLSCSVINKKNISNVSEGKSYVSEQIEKLNNKYNDLCSQKRNDQLKSQFVNLESEIQEINGFGYTCPKLSYDEQKEVSEYVITKLKGYPNLVKLANASEIDCW